MIKFFKKDPNSGEELEFDNFVDYKKKCKSEVKGSSNTNFWGKIIAKIDMNKIMRDTIDEIKLNCPKSYKETLITQQLSNKNYFDIEEHFIYVITKKNKEIFWPESILDDYTLYENKGKKTSIIKKNTDAEFINSLEQCSELIENTKCYLDHFLTKEYEPKINFDNEFFHFRNIEGYYPIYVLISYRNFANMKVKTREYFEKITASIRNKKKILKFPISFLFYVKNNTIYVSEQNAIYWLDGNSVTLSN